jgi:crossover junction endodeoxyribonuclease RuvC
VTFSTHRRPNLPPGERGGAILGLDPGSRRTGYALAAFRRGEIVTLEVGAWRVASNLTRELALASLTESAEGWIRSRDIEVAAVESLFHHKNARTALALAEARGALLAVLGRCGVPVCEYPPATVKLTICGAGRADKEQVRRALILTVPGLSESALEGHGLDATDALAIAVTHFVHARRAAAAAAPR